MATLLVFVVAGFLLIGAVFSCGKQRAIESPPKGNTPPSITSVQILPEKPTKESEFSLLVQCQDPEGDPMSYEYQWLRNDVEIPGENKSMLARGSSGKGILFASEWWPAMERPRDNPSSLLLSGW